MGAARSRRRPSLPEDGVRFPANRRQSAWCKGKHTGPGRPHRTEGRDGDRGTTEAHRWDEPLRHGQAMALRSGGPPPLPGRHRQVFRGGLYREGRHVSADLEVPGMVGVMAKVRTQTAEAKARVVPARCCGTCRSWVCTRGRAGYCVRRPIVFEDEKPVGFFATLCTDGCDWWGAL